MDPSPPKTEAGIAETPGPLPEADLVLPLGDRIKQMWSIIKDQPIKATEMAYVILYDISNDKVRPQIAKYLEKQGCTRNQKSVFIAKTENPHFQEIYETLNTL